MTSPLSPKLFFESAVQSAPILSSATHMISPEMAILQVQMLVAKNFDEQIREIADKLKFLKDVSQTYRNNTSKVNTFLAAPSKESHHGNKPALITTAAQGADLLAALTTYDYNLDTKTMISKGINMIDLESKHKMSPDDTRQGLTNTLEASAFMGNLAKISDRGEYIAEAKKIGDNNDLRLPFYYSSKSNDGIDGKPVMTFFVEGLEKLSQVMESKIAGIDTEIEKLSTELTDLTEKRKSAIDSANDVIKKINEVKTNTVSKM